MSCAHRLCGAAWLAVALAIPASAGGQSAPSESPLLSEWSVRADASLEISQTHREQWQPVSLAPDVYVGLPHFTVGLIHSTRAAGLLDSGHGLCLRSQSEIGCFERYRGPGIDAMHALYAHGGLELAARLRLYVARFRSPARPRVSPGFVVRYGGARWSVLADPHIDYGLANRGNGNENTLVVPVWLGVRLGGAVDTFLRTGIRGGLTGFADEWAAPFGLGVGVSWPERWRFELQAALPKAIGPLNDHRPRDLLIRASYLVR